MILKEMFDYVDSTDWKDDVLNQQVIDIAQKFCDNLDDNITKKPLFHRICGQSGTGKTTQINASLQNNLKKMNLNPVHIAVRVFSTLHPNYDSLLKQFGESHMREKTNSFALKCLCAVLYKLIKEKVYIVLEVTILDVKFEKFVNKLLSDYKYRVKFHLMAVNTKISKIFIEKRRLESGDEKGRIIYNKTSNYFNKMLPIGLKYYAKNKLEYDLVMWNAFDLEPCFVGRIKDCYTAFKKNQRKIKKFIYSENELLQSKTHFYKKNKDKYM